MPPPPPVWFFFFCLLQWLKGQSCTLMILIIVPLLLPPSTKHPDAAPVPDRPSLKIIPLSRIPAKFIVNSMQPLKFKSSFLIVSIVNWDVIDNTSGFFLLLLLSFSKLPQPSFQDQVPVVQLPVGSIWCFNLVVDWIVETLSTVETQYLFNEIFGTGTDCLLYQYLVNKQYKTKEIIHWDRRN